MRKSLTKPISLLIVAVIAIGMLIIPVPGINDANANAASGITKADIDRICTKYGFENGSYWTYNYNNVSNTASSLDAAAQSGFKASKTPYGSTYGSSLKSTMHKGEYWYQGYRQCIGFCELIGREITGKSPHTQWTHYTSVSAVNNAGGIKVGDVIRAGGHSAMVLTVSGSTFTTVECWGSEKSKNCINYNGKFNSKYNTISAIPNLEYVARFNGSVNPQPTPTYNDVKLSNFQVSDLTSDSCKISCTVDDKGYTAYECVIVAWKGSYIRHEYKPIRSGNTLYCYVRRSDLNGLYDTFNVTFNTSPLAGSSLTQWKTLQFTFVKPVVKTDLNQASIKPIPNQIYTGQSIVPALNLTYNNYSLVLNKDYRIDSIVNNVNVGTATITISGIGNYYGSRAITFNIVNQVEILNVEESLNTDLPAVELTVTYRINNPTSQDREIYVDWHEGKVGTFIFVLNGWDRIETVPAGQSVTNTCTFYLHGKRNYISFSESSSRETIFEYEYRPSDITGPEVSDIEVTNISDDGYDISIKCSDPSGLGCIDGRNAFLYDSDGNRIAGFNPRAYTDDGYYVYHVDKVAVGTYTHEVHTYDLYQNRTVLHFETEIKRDQNGQLVVTLLNSGNTPNAKPSATPTPTAKPTATPTNKPTTTPKPTAMPTPVKPGNSNTSSSTSTGLGDFIERLYNVALGRPSEAYGKNYWINKVKLEGFTGADVARGFLFSEEFLGKNMSNSDFLDTLYLTFFNRPADEHKADWMTLMDQGWTKMQVIDGFINSTEWANLCLSYSIASGSNCSPNINIQPSAEVESFARRLYTTCLGRDADIGGLNNWAAQLANMQISGSQAAHGFFFSEEFIAHGFSNEEYVNRLYRTFMGREADPAGFADWVGQLNSGVSRESVFQGFAGSQEWAGICAEYGILK